MMKLHVFPPSPRAIKVMGLANHLGLDCELRIVDLFKGEQQKPEFAALNLNKKMPVLEDHGFVLWESNAILQYLASKKPESGLWPTHPQRQADVSRWQFWDMAHWDPSCAILVFERVVKKLSGQGDPDPAQIAKGEHEFHRYADVLNRTLKGRKWLAGSDLTVADFSLGAGMVYAAQAELPLARYPDITRWYESLAAIPGWKKALPGGAS
jgi:glutathione S-transferase